MLRRDEKSLAIVLHVLFDGVVARHAACVLNAGPGRTECLSQFANFPACVYLCALHAHQATPSAKSYRQRISLLVIPREIENEAAKGSRDMDGKTEG
jgi:hypothetical protein